VRGAANEEETVNFSNILIGSEDPQRLVEYYSRLLGKPVMEDGGYAGWQIGSGFVAIGPHDEVKGKSVHPGRIIWNIESDDVPGDFERFKAAGATVVREPYNPAGAGVEGMLIATFADPDDNYFQLQSPYRPEA
jgi:predicted enzyme related to lactoylglutathione lyase